MEKEMKKYAFYHINISGMLEKNSDGLVKKETKRLQDFFGTKVKVFGVPTLSTSFIEMTNF